MRPSAFAVFTLMTASARAGSTGRNSTAIHPSCLLRAGGAPEDAPERPRELAVRDGRGRDDVDRPGQRLVHERVQDGTERVVHPDPAHPRGPRADEPAEAEPEDREHRAERPALGAQHDADPEMHDADPAP